MLDRLARRLRPIAVPHLTVYLIGGQVLACFVCLAQPAVFDRIVLVRDADHDDRRRAYHDALGAHGLDADPRLIADVVADMGSP